MSHEPHLWSRALTPLHAGLEALGHDPWPLFEASGIPRAACEDPDGRVSHVAAMRFWEVAVEHTGDRDLGLHLAEAAPVDSFELHSYALLSCASLREAYRRGVRYQRLIHEAAELVFEEPAQDEEVAILRHSLQGGRAVPRQSAEFLVTTWHRLGCLVTGTRWMPELVCFAHPEPPNVGEHRRLLGGELRFGAGVNALHLPSAALDRPNPRADPALAEMLDRYARQLLERAPPVSTLAQRVRAVVSRNVEEGAPTAAEVADDLNLSVRSLHRGLREEGTTYRAVLEGFRHERAAVLLADARYGIADVAYLVGFAELSSFYRAFKRWTGSTPAEWRDRAFSSG